MSGSSTGFCTCLAFCDQCSLSMQKSLGTTRPFRRFLIASGGQREGHGRLHDQRLWCPKLAGGIGSSQFQPWFGFMKLPIWSPWCTHHRARCWYKCRPTATPELASPDTGCEGLKGEMGALPLDLLRFCWKQFWWQEFDIDRNSSCSLRSMTSEFIVHSSIQGFSQQSAAQWPQELRKLRWIFKLCRHWAWPFQLFKGQAVLPQAELGAFVAAAATLSAPYRTWAFGTTAEGRNSELRNVSQGNRPTARISERHRQHTILCIYCILFYTDL